MVGNEAVLFANDAFYQAFHDRDVDAMEEIWAEKTQPTCIHPGWQPLFGRQTVMKSWLAILANPGSPKIRCHNARATRIGSLAYVICYEEIDGQFLIATNIFTEEETDQGRTWRLLHHQSGPTADAPEPEETGPPVMN